MLILSNYFLNSLQLSKSKKILALCFPLFLSSCFKNNSPQKSKKKVESLEPIVLLGKHLFFDKRLSKDNTVSCNSCHDITQRKAGIDSLATSKGINGQKGGRNAPTVWNAKFHSVQFWDGRAKNLAEQAKGPITNPIEMGMPNHDLAVTRVKAIKGYQELFKKAYPAEKEPINIDNLAQAIAKFEETLEALNSPFDKFKAGEKKAISTEAQEGYKLFQNTGCIACHSGDHFSGPTLPLGVGFYQKFPTFPAPDFEKQYELSKDLGRYEVTKKESDKHMFRVPTLRNIALTAPYFHNGKVKTLNEAVRVMAKTQLHKDLKEDEVKKIVSFLETLTGEIPEIKTPKPLS